MQISIDISGNIFLLIMIEQPKYKKALGYEFLSKCKKNIWLDPNDFCIWNEPISLRGYTLLRVSLQM